MHESGNGPNRTNWTVLTMSVVRVDRKWLAQGQTVAIDPQRTFTWIPSPMVQFLDTRASLLPLVGKAER